MIGAILLVGPILLLDLRILGYARGLAADALSRAAAPLAATGLATMLLSGAIIFVSDPVTFSDSALFRIKLALLALALINALAFRRRWRVLEETSPPMARMQAAASIALWLGIVTMGRLIAYY